MASAVMGPPGKGADLSQLEKRLVVARFIEWSASMCDYSLHNVATRPAKVGDQLKTRDFGTGTRGFAASEDASVAVCLRPGTELSFDENVRCGLIGSFEPLDRVIRSRTAIFRQINADCPYTHHDALEFPNGDVVLLTCLAQGQAATVLQLPADAAPEHVPHGDPVAV